MQYRFRKVHIFLTSSLYIILLGYIKKQGFVFVLKPWESYYSSLLYLYMIADEYAHLKDGYYFKVIFNMFLYKHLKYIVLWLSLLIKSHSLVFVSYRYNPEPWLNVNSLLCLLDGLTYINMKAEHFKLFFQKSQLLY